MFCEVMYWNEKHDSNIGMQNHRTFYFGYLQQNSLIIYRYFSSVHHVLDLDDYNEYKKKFNVLIFINHKPWVNFH